jgi:hypothetical protein
MWRLPHAAHIIVLLFVTMRRLLLSVAGASLGLTTAAELTDPFTHLRDRLPLALHLVDKLTLSAPGLPTFCSPSKKATKTLDLTLRLGELAARSPKLHAPVPQHLGIPIYRHRAGAATVRAGLVPISTPSNAFPVTPAARARVNGPFFRTC